MFSLRRASESAVDAMYEVVLPVYRETIARCPLIELLSTRNRCVRNNVFTATCL